MKGRAPRAARAPVRPPAGARARALAGAVLSTAAALAILLACQPALQQETGVVLSIDSPALGRVDSFELLNSDGEVLTFDTSEMGFRPEFPASHLAEHQVLSDPIRVSFRTEGERLVVTELDDAD